MRRLGPQGKVGSKRGLEITTAFASDFFATRL